MTLVAAFRCPQDGILLCADGEEDDGYNKREVEKLYRISGLKECEVYIAGAGPSDAIAKTQFVLHEALSGADSNTDLLKNHRALLESKLQEIHKQYAANLKEWPMQLLIVLAPRGENYIPILYRTNKAMLVPEYEYAAYGSGRPIADYLADRLFEYGHLESRAMGISHQAQGWKLAHSRVHRKHHPRRKR